MAAQMSFKRIRKPEALKRFIEGKPFYLCPCKLYPSSPWNVAYLCVSGKEWMESADRHGKESKLWEGSRERTAWQLMMNNWCYYNATYETGYYPHFYIEA